MHSCSWYSFQFHVEKSELQTDHIIEEYETSLVVHALSDSKLSIDEASEQFVRQIPVSFHDSDRFLHREVIDSRLQFASRHFLIRLKCFFSSQEFSIFRKN